jgi:hypothetical protein
MNEPEKDMSYKAVRDRLMNPTNAVPDHGIDLTRKSTAYKGDILPPGTPPKRKLVPEVFYPVIKTPRELNISFDDILNETCSFYEIDQKSIMDGCRRQERVMVRRVVVFLSMRLLKKRSMSSIARDLNQDHTTILHSRNKIMEQIEGSNRLSEEVDLIEEKILAKYRSGPAVPALSESIAPEPPGPGPQIQGIHPMDHQCTRALVGSEG